MRHRSLVVAQMGKPKTNEGRNGEYVPGISRRFSSLGVRTSIASRKVDHVPRTLSKLETIYFRSLEMSPYVSDIKDQFVLDSTLTRECARKLGLKHPVDEMTTDVCFKLTLPSSQPRLIARSIKYLRDLAITRNQEIAEIERLAWTTRNADFGIITEFDADQIVANNSQWLNINAGNPKGPPVAEKVLHLLESQLRQSIEKGLRLGEACKRVDADLGIGRGAAMGSVRYLVNTGVWAINPRRPIDPYELFPLLYSRWA